MIYPNLKHVPMLGSSGKSSKYFLINNGVAKTERTAIYYWKQPADNDWKVSAINSLNFLDVAEGATVP